MGIMSEPEISPPVQTFAAAAGGVAAVTQGNVSEVRQSEGMVLCIMVSKVMVWKKTNCMNDDTWSVKVMPPLTTVQSSYTPAKLEKHLEFCEFSPGGDLLVGSSSLTTRYWSGSVWYYRRGVLADRVTDPASCLAGLELEGGLSAARFQAEGRAVLGMDSGAVAGLRLARQQDGDQVTFHLELGPQLIEHDDILTGLDCWQEGGVASVGQDARLNILSPELGLLHSYQPAHTGGCSAVACSPTNQHCLATAGRVAGEVRVWDTRQSRPARTVYTSLEQPACSVVYHGKDEPVDTLVVGTATGALLLLDTRASAVPLASLQCGDRPVVRLRASPYTSGPGGKIALSAEDCRVWVVSLPSLSGLSPDLILDWEDSSSHTDYVRGLGWVGPAELWTCGWDKRVVAHNL